MTPTVDLSPDGLAKLRELAEKSQRGPYRWTGEFLNAFPAETVLALLTEYEKLAAERDRMREAMNKAYNVLDRYAFDTFDWLLDEGKLARGVLPVLEAAGAALAPQGEPHAA